MEKHNFLIRFWLWLRWGSYNHIKRFQFNFNAREILKTSSIQPLEESCIILSLISHCDLWMYLVSAKSFTHFFKKGKFIVLNDGSLTISDIQILRDHINGVEIINIKTVINEQCPKGGCWERLLCVADRVKDSYVIVLDADTVTLAVVPEVLDCVEKNHSFIVGVKENQMVKSMKQVLQEEVKNYGKRELNASCHIQTVFDTNMDKISGYENLNYLKGSGGFNGFAKGSFSRENVEKFSKRMQGIFGERWKEWGTEQITVCFLIANSHGAVILPYPQYAIYYANPKVNYKNCSFLHFIGMSRFKNNFYINCAKNTLKVLV